MREPTPQDSQTWANTLIATVMIPVVFDNGTSGFELQWQRFEKGDKVVEVLEGSNTKYHLRYESTSSLRLIGVEEEIVTTQQNKTNE